MITLRAPFLPILHSQKMNDFTKSLPPEVWLVIFDYIGLVRTLRQCRLVCRSWRPLVDKIAYKVLNLPSDETKLAKLSDCLVMRPTLGHSVQEIHVLGSDMWPQMYKIFRYTPNLKAIDGRWCEILVNILQRPECLALKLEKLPCIVYNTKPLDLETMLRFKETLRTAAFNFDRVTPYDYRALGNTLNQLKHLQQLRIEDEYTFKSIRDLDHLLKNCNQIQLLQLDIRQHDNYIHTDKVELEQWLENSVQRVETVKSLTIDFVDDSLADEGKQPRDIGPDWMYYLAYKYPSLTRLEVNSEEYHRQHLILPKCIHMDTFVLRNWIFYDINVLKQFIDRLATQSVYIQCAVNYEIDCSNRCICLMSAAKKAPTDYTTFSLEVPYDDNIEANTISILSLFSSRLIKKLEIGLYEDDHLEIICAWMKCSLNVESIKITTDNQLLPECPGQPILAVLHRLEIVNTKFKSDFMTQLSKYAPNLTHLTLDNCTFGDVVLMPNIQLASLSLRKTSLKGRICTDLLFAISTDKGPGQIFLASPRKPLQRVTGREAQLLKPFAIYIKCGSLRHLSVNLQDIRFEMEFSNADNLIERVDCDIEDSYYLTLERNMKILMENQEKMKTRIELAEGKYFKSKKYLTALQIKDIEDSMSPCT